MSACDPSRHLAGIYAAAAKPEPIKDWSLTSLKES